MIVNFSAHNAFFDDMDVKRKYPPKKKSRKQIRKPKY